MRARTIASSAIATAALLGVTPGVAAAADIEYATEIGSSGPGPADQRYVSRYCPGTTAPLGGGMYSSGGYGTSYLNSTAPYFQGATRTYEGWVGRIIGTSEVAVTTVVACVGGRARRGLEYPREGRFIGGGKTGDVTAKCPPNHKVTGGGLVQASPYPAGELKASRPSRRNTAWYVESRNLTPDSGKIIAYAICAANVLAKKLAYRQTVMTAAPGVQTSATTDCPGQSEVVGGGVQARGPALSVNSTGVQSSGAGSASFVDNVGAPAKFTNYAVCHG